MKRLLAYLVMLVFTVVLYACNGDKACWTPVQGQVGQGGTGPVTQWPTGGLGDDVGSSADPSADATPESQCSPTTQCRCEGQVFCEWIGTKDHPVDPDVTGTMFFCEYVNYPGDSGWINGTCDQVISGAYALCRELIIEKPEVKKMGMDTIAGWECGHTADRLPGTPPKELLVCKSRPKP